MQKCAECGKTIAENENKHWAAMGDKPHDYVCDTCWDNRLFKAIGLK